MGFNALFNCDALSMFMAAVAGTVGILILIYSIGYISRYPHKLEFFSFMIIFLLAMVGLMLSANLLLMYIFWEITALCSWKLIGFYRKEKEIWFADKAFLVTFFGASMMLAGIILIYLQYGTMDFALLKGKSVSGMVVFLFMMGIFAKSAQLPLSGWLPDAGVAPTPVTALLHAAVLVKIGVYAYARFFNDLFVMPDEARTWIMGIAVVSGIIAAMSALVEQNIKRILAYSTISQLSYIFLALAINTPLSIGAGLLYVLVHSFGKAGLFLSAGIVEQRTHTKELSELGGLGPYMPVVAGAFLLNAFSIIGLPPFGGFFSKFYVILTTAEAGHLVLAGAGILTAFVTLLYLMKMFNGIFTGPVRTQVVGKTPFTMSSVVVICALVSLAIGIWIRYPLDLVNSIGGMLVK